MLLDIIGVMLLIPVEIHIESYFYCYRYDWKKEKRADNVE